MPNTPTTRKMSLLAFSALSLAGLVLEYVYSSDGAAGFLFFLNEFGILGLFALPVFRALMLVVLAVCFFLFEKNPNNKTSRSLMVFFAPMLLSLIGVVAAYLILRDRKAI
jgi:hypothetical protein